jgi:hypothetical protein
MDKLYILKEEFSQVDYPTKVKYLYTSEVNKQLLTLTHNKEVVYLSNNFGILYPNNIQEPYKVLPLKNRKLWVLLTSEMIHRICTEKNITTISLLFSGDFEDLKKRLTDLNYCLEQPLQFFRTNKLRLFWINNEILNNIVKRVSI